MGARSVYGFLLPIVWCAGASHLFQEEYQLSHSSYIFGWTILIPILWTIKDSLGASGITALFLVLTSIFGWIGVATWTMLFLMINIFGGYNNDTKVLRSDDDIVIDEPLAKMPTPEKIVEAEETPQNIVIAVSASPSRAAGVIILHKVHTFLYYSIDWSNFQNEADKLEVMNALLALKIFEWYTSEHCKWLRESLAGNPLILKMDNEGSTNESGRKNMSFLEQVVRANPIMTIQYANVKTDSDLKIADELSRKDCSQSATLEVIEEFQKMYYQIIDVSKYDCSYFFETVKKLVPKMNGTKKSPESGRNQKLKEQKVNKNKTKNNNNIKTM